MPAVDQAPAEAAFRFGILIEMDARRVLVEPRRQLMFGFFDSDAVDMVNSFPDPIVVKAILAAGKPEVIGLDVDGWARVAQHVRQHYLHDPWHMQGRRRRILVALV